MSAVRLGEALADQARYCGDEPHRHLSGACHGRAVLAEIVYAAAKLRAVLVAGESPAAVVDILEQALARVEVGPDVGIPIEPAAEAPPISSRQQLREYLEDLT